MGGGQVDIRRTGRPQESLIPRDVGWVREAAAEFRPADNVVVCAHGTRSSIAASLLRNAGRTDVSDLIGGYDAWQRVFEPARA